jgi:hypothetical protein
LQHSLDTLRAVSGGEDPLIADEGAAAQIPSLLVDGGEPGPRGVSAGLDLLRLGVQSFAALDVQTSAHRRVVLQHVVVVAIILALGNLGQRLVAHRRLVRIFVVTASHLHII